MTNTLCSELSNCQDGTFEYTGDCLWEPEYIRIHNEWAWNDDIMAFRRMEVSLSVQTVERFKGTQVDPVSAEKLLRLLDLGQ